MDDLISRQAAVDAVNDLTKWYCETYHETRPTTIAVIDTLNQLPSAQPTQTDTFNTLKALDCVERQAAIDLIERMKPYHQTSDDIAEMIHNMPSARPELRWIPCSPETMPKKTGYYLVQYTRKYCRKEMAVAFYSVKEARCDDDYTWEIETFSDIKEVIAWRPLPEPYNEEE